MSKLFKIMSCPICLSNVGIFYKTSPCQCKVRYHIDCYNLMKKNNNINCCFCRSSLKQEINIFQNIKLCLTPILYFSNLEKKEVYYILLFFDTLFFCEFIENIYKLLFNKIILIQFAFVSIWMLKNYYIRKYLNIINE